MSIEELCDTDSGFTNWVRLSQPDAVIVEGFPNDDVQRDSLKQYISNDIMTCNRKGKKSIKVKTPTFIFCTSDPEPLNLDAADRRFFVIDMKGKI